MAFAPLNHIDTSTLAGQFKHADTGIYFDYAELSQTEWRPLFNGPYGHLTYPNAKIFVGPTGEETRYAYVMKTKVYVVVDELEEGQYAVESWPIKQHRIFKETQK